MGVDVSGLVLVDRARSREVMPANRPRVLHIVPALFGTTGIVGGAERYALELARHMAEHVPTRLVTFGSEPGERAVDRLNVRVLSGGWAVRGQTANRWSPAMLGEIMEADVVHCHQQHVLMSSTAAAVCRVTGRRVFVTDLGGGGWDVSAYVSTDAWFHGHLHISEYSRTVFGHQQTAHARVILGGVDTAKFSPAPDLEKDGRVLFVGRLLPHKGIANLIEALPQELSLDIIGPPNDSPYVARLHSLAEGKSVRFRHDCSDDMLVDAYRRALCVVLPSLYRTPEGETNVPELLGQTLLEAMACGTPVVATRVASLPEIVEDGRNGFLVPADDRGALAQRLRWLRQHPADAAAFGACGRDIVLKRFQWPQVVERCLEAYSCPSSI
jgi:glycosyltransferase involved in cell wall biosynthesis